MTWQRKQVSSWKMLCPFARIALQFPPPLPPLFTDRFTVNALLDFTPSPPPPPHPRPTDRFTVNALFDFTPSSPPPPPPSSQPLFHHLLTVNTLLDFMTPSFFPLPSPLLFLLFFLGGGGGKRKSLCMFVYASMCVCVCARACVHACVCVFYQQLGRVLTTMLLPSISALHDNMWTHTVIRRSKKLATGLENGCQMIDIIYRYWSDTKGKPVQYVIYSDYCWMPSQGETRTQTAAIYRPMTRNDLAFHSLL